MKKRFLKIILVTAISAATALICNSSVMAETILHSSSGYTDKVVITITGQGYYNLNEPAGGVHVRTYGVRAFTVGYGDNSNDISTTFSIRGSLRKPDSSKPFSKSATGEICDYSYNTTYEMFIHVDSTITTSSSYYGYSSQESNYNC